MRRSVAVVAAVLLGSIAAVGAGVAGAIGTASAASAASAASEPSITIKAIDREGKAVAVTASLESPVISPSAINETLTSAHATAVPKGTYNIAAWVPEPSGAQTLVDSELVVSKSETVTFDARKGKLVRFTVNDPSATVLGVEAEPYNPNGWWAFNTAGGPAGSEPTYVVPGKMAPGYVLYLEATLTRPETGSAVSPVEYVLVKRIDGTIPSDLTFSYKAAQLATDHVTVRAIDTDGNDEAFLEPELGGGNLPTAPTGQDGTPPFSVTFHLSPGYQWQSSTASGTDNLNDLPVLGVHSYSQTFDNAVYGPSPEFGPTVNGSELEPSTLPWGQYLLDDPTQQMDTSFGLTPAATQSWIYKGSKLLTHVTNKAFSTSVSATPAWYTMRVQVNRGKGARLFTTETLSYNFEAYSNDNAVLQSDFWPRIIPSGLTDVNAAKPGTKTTVINYFSDLNGNIVAHDVRVWASVNDGKTWTAVRVSASGPHWSAVVTNPKTAGFVSLRVAGTDSSGFTATVTVIHAYAVG
jgi:hypothetical protein